MNKPASMPATSQGSKYTDDIRREAAVQFAVKGNYQAVADTLNIPKTTIQSWKNQDWFNEIIIEVRSEKSNEHIARYSELTSKALDRALDQIDNASARDATIIAATATDKQRLLMSLPTSIKGESGGIQALADAFRKLSEDYRRDKERKIVSDQ